jgi:YaiO family outer membrane protein
LLFTLLLVGMLAQSTSEAVDLENAGRYEEALEAYQRLASASPGDHQVRLAIGRLHLRLRHPDRAETVYRGVTLEDGSSLAAHLGLADALFAQWRPEEALDMLERAAAIAPEDPEVLARLGRAHQEIGHGTQGVGYLGRAASISASPEHQLSLERARGVHDHHVELRSFAEQFNGGTPDSHQGDLSLDVRVTDRLRVNGRGQYQRKFSTSDARGGAGVAWRRTPYTTFVVQALVGPDNRVMPIGDYLGAIDYRVGAVRWNANVRYFDFDGVQVIAASPGLAWSASNRLSLGLRYAFTRTDVSGFSGAEEGHTAQIHGSYRVHPRVWVNAGYARGVEDFDNFSIDRAGHFRAHTGSAGVRVDLRGLTSVIGTYEYQARKNDVEMQRISLSLSQRF